MLIWVFSAAQAALDIAALCFVLALVAGSNLHSDSPHLRARSYMLASSRLIVKRLSSGTADLALRHGPADLCINYLHHLTYFAMLCPCMSPGKSPTSLCFVNGPHINLKRQDILY